MFDINFNVPILNRAIRELLDVLGAENSRQIGIDPHYRPTAAGRDFSAHGAALDEVFAALYQQRQDRLSEFTQTTEALQSEIDRVKAADEASGQELSAIDQGGATWEK